MKSFIPKYLTLKNNLIWQVVGTAIFAELFILLFKPFDSYSWADEHFLIYFGYATFVVLVAMGIIAISRTILCYFAKKREVTVVDYVIWHIAEFSAMSVIYTIFAVVLSTNSWDDFGELFKQALLYTSLILLIPYAIFILYFSLKDKQEQLEEVRNNSNTEKSSTDELINFCDDKGDLKLSIRSSSLCYIESSDNYVTIYYDRNGKINKYMLRSTLKRLEEEHKDNNLIRCHRSYIVNFDKVQMLQKKDDGLSLSLSVDGIRSIPVSKTYSNNVITAFNV